LVISEDDKPARTVAITVSTTGMDEKMESLTLLGLASWSEALVSFINFSDSGVQTCGFYLRVARKSDTPDVRDNV
jgi:hypothetical protein